jgi:hypothetical protein
MQFAIIEKITTIRKEGEIDGPATQLNIIENAIEKSKYNYTAI